MSRLLKWWMVVLLVVGVAGMATAQIAQDDGSNYAGGWTNLSNGGFGFDAWVLATGGDAAHAIADPADSEITGMSDTAFRLSGTTGYVDADRPFSAPLSLGDTFSVQWGNNWDTDGGGNKGINLYSGGAGGAQLININMGGSATITINGDNMFTNYGTAAITFNFEYVNATTLRVYADGRDGVETYDNTFTISGAPDAVRFYAGELAAGVNRLPYIDNLEINSTTNQLLSLTGIDAMAAGVTNLITVFRTGGTNDALVVSLASDDTDVATVPVDVTIPAGEASAEFELSGVGLGAAEITASAVDFDDATLDVVVYDIAYDDSAYYSIGTWTNESNGGLGFGEWTLTNNDGEEVGYTNFAGAILGNSTFGGPNVNASSGNAFGLYANSAGDGDAESTARREFADLGVGESFAFEIGVNFRNGSKGAVIQNGTDWLFELAVYADEYWIQNHSQGEAPVALGWDYAADSAIEFIISRLDTDTYSVSLERRGSTTESELFNNIMLNDPPNAVRFFVFDTDGGGDQNNLFFNRLAIYTGTIGSIDPVLSFGDARDAMAFFTNVFTVSRTGPTDAALTVNLESSDTNVLSVPAVAEIAVDDSSITFDVVGLALGSATITASAVGFDPITYDVDVVADIAYDDSQYYASWTDASNGGGGFQPWVLSNNDGPDVVHTNFAGAILGSSLVNSSAGNSFGLYANSEGDGDALSEAARTFDAPLGVGESISFRMAVNFRNGSKGVMFQNNDDWLFEVAVFSDDYWYNVHDVSDDPQWLGWDYAADTVIEVTMSRVDTNSYNVLIERSGSAPESELIQNVTLSEPPNRVRFYVFNTDSGGDENNLFFNNLALFTGIVEGEDEGPEIANFSVVLVGGLPEASVEVGVGEDTVTYRLYYTTDLTADPIVWTLADTAVGNGVDVITLVDDDEENEDAMRIYALSVEE